MNYFVNYSLIYWSRYILFTELKEFPPLMKDAKAKLSAIFFNCSELLSFMT